MFVHSGTTIFVHSNLKQTTELTYFLEYKITEL